MKNQLNVELFKKIREKIATTPEAYDQGSYGRKEPNAPCGTAACIAGWASLLSGRVELAQVQSCNVFDKSMDLVHDSAVGALGLNDEESAILFTEDPGGHWVDYDDEGNDMYENGGPNRLGATGA